MTDQKENRIANRARLMLKLKYPLLAALCLNGIIVLKATVVQVTGGTPTSGSAVASMVDPPTPAVMQTPEVQGDIDEAIVELINTTIDSSASNDEEPENVEAIAGSNDTLFAIGRHLGSWATESTTRSSEMGRSVSDGMTQAIDLLASAKPNPDPTAEPVPVQLENPQPSQNETTPQGDEEPLPVQPKGHSTITIRNPADTGGDVFFMFQDEVVGLRAGESRQFPISNTASVAFHRGGNFGNTQMELTEGSYQFVVTSHGWDVQLDR